MKPVTRWLRLNPKTNTYEHNHLEDGHVTSDYPTDQKGNSLGWRKQFGYLDENCVFQPVRI